MDAKKREREQNLAAATLHYHGHRERLRERFREAGPTRSPSTSCSRRCCSARCRGATSSRSLRLIATFGFFAELIAAPAARLAGIRA